MSTYSIYIVIQTVDVMCNDHLYILIGSWWRINDTFPLPNRRTELIQGCATALNLRENLLKFLLFPTCLSYSKRDEAPVKMPAEPFTLLDLAELIRDRERNTLSRKILIHYNKKFLSKFFFGFYTHISFSGFPLSCLLFCRRKSRWRSSSRDVNERRTLPAGRSRFRTVSPWSKKKNKQSKSESYVRCCNAQRV